MPKSALDGLSCQAVQSVDHLSLPARAVMPVFPSAYTIPRPLTRPVARLEVLCWCMWPCGWACAAEKRAERAKRIDWAVNNIFNE